MERWYLPIYCLPRGRGDKRVDRIIGEITNYIRTSHLYNLVPVVHVEKKPKGEFYIFIGIESEQSALIPQELVPLIEHIGHAINKAVDHDAIKPMIEGTIITQDYARRIAYVTRREIEQDDPFDLSEDNLPQLSATHREDKLYLGDCDKLLYWLSAVGSGTWLAFKNICADLGLDDSGHEAKRILRKLRLLGHIETSRDGSSWSITPPCIISVGVGDKAEYILAGQRNIQLLEDIKSFSGGNFECINQDVELAPAAIRFVPEGKHDLDALLASIDGKYPLSYVGNASSKLAEILPDIGGWRDQLESVGKLMVPLYEVEKFTDGTFAHRVFNGETGFYRLRPHDNSNQIRHTLFFHRDSQRWLRGDWYGLRFLALQEGNEKCRVIYHRDKRQLAILSSQRWPELYERALVLCSGQLAEQQRDWLIFNRISREIAYTLASKLSVIYEEV